MAPIMTAVEFVFSPNDAIKMAKINIHMLEPLNSIPSRIACTVVHFPGLVFDRDSVLKTALQHLMHH